MRHLSNHTLDRLLNRMLLAEPDEEEQRVNGVVDVCEDTIDDHVERGSGDEPILDEVDD